MVRVVIDNQIFGCRDYFIGDNHIVLYDVWHEESKWKEIEIFKKNPAITIFKHEIVEDIPW